MLLSIRACAFCPCRWRKSHSRTVAYAMFSHGWLKTRKTYHEPLDGDLAIIAHQDGLCLVGPRIARRSNKAGTWYLVGRSEAQRMKSNKPVSCNAQRRAFGDSLGTVSTYHVQQGRIVLRVDFRVEFPHETRFVDKGKASNRMDVGKVMLHEPPDLRWRWDLGKRSHCRVSLDSNGTTALACVSGRSPGLPPSSLLLLSRAA
jgi:hypothetical protein